MNRPRSWLSPTNCSSSPPLQRIPDDKQLSGVRNDWYCFTVRWTVKSTHSSKHAVVARFVNRWIRWALALLRTAERDETQVIRWMSHTIGVGIHPPAYTWHGFAYASSKADFSRYTLSTPSGVRLCPQKRVQPFFLWEAVEVTAVDSPAELPSVMLDLVPLSLAELRTHPSPQLREAVQAIIAGAAAGRFGDSIQGQRD